jgi:hypothetical protein
MFHALSTLHSDDDNPDWLLEFICMFASRSPSPPTTLKLKQFKL